MSEELNAGDLVWVSSTAPNRSLDSEKARVFDASDGRVSIQFLNEKPIYNFSQISGSRYRSSSGGFVFLHRREEPGAP